MVLLSKQFSRLLGRFGIPAVSILLTVLTLALVRRPTSSVRPPAAGTIYRVPVSGREAALGPAEAQVTVVAFFDLSCQFSRHTYQTLAELVKQPGRTTRLVFKHRPILPHGKGRRAALLAERARAQGKFWEAVELLFGKLGDVEDPEVVRSLQALGVSPDHVPVTLLGDSEAAVRVRHDIALARRLGVAATPTLFVNGERFNGAISSRLLGDTVERHRLGASEALARGVPPAKLYEHLVQQGRDQRELAPPRFDSALGTSDRVVAPGPGDVPVRVDLFCSDGCALCREVEQRLQRLSREAPVRLAVRSLGVDGDAAAARRLGVWRVPTLFINGRVIVGAIGEHRLLEELEAEVQRAPDDRAAPPPAPPGMAIDSPAFVEVTFPEVTPQQAFEAWIGQRLERAPSCLDLAGGDGALGVQAVMTVEGAGFRLEDVRVTPAELSAGEGDCFARTLAFSGPVRLPLGAQLRKSAPHNQLQTRIVLDAQARLAARRNSCSVR